MKVRALAVSALLAAAGAGAYAVGQSDTPDRPTFTATSGTVCGRQKPPVVVRLPARRWPHIADHIRDAQRPGVHRGDPVEKAYPATLHIDRTNATRHRYQSTSRYPTRKGYDRDEYPPAMSREGGAGADVRYVLSGENRAAGASLGGQLRPWCEGQGFKIVTR